MKRIFQFIGWIFLIPGLLLCFLGVLALPDGGLMFAMPYFFLVPGIALTLIGGLMLLLTRFFRKTRYEQGDVTKQMNSGGRQ